MSDTAIIAITAAVVLIAIILLVAFSKGWIKSFFFNKGDVAVGANAPDDDKPSTTLSKSSVKNKSKIDNKSGRFRASKSTIDDSEIKNG